MKLLDEVGLPFVPTLSARTSGLVPVDAFSIRATWVVGTAPASIDAVAWKDGAVHDAAPAETSFVALTFPVTLTSPITDTEPCASSAAPTLVATAWNAAPAELEVAKTAAPLPVVEARMPLPLPDSSTTTPL